MSAVQRRLRIPEHIPDKGRRLRINSPDGRYTLLWKKTGLLRKLVLESDEEVARKKEEHEKRLAAALQKQMQREQAQSTRSQGASSQGCKPQGTQSQRPQRRQKKSQRNRGQKIVLTYPGNTDPPTLNPYAPGNRPRKT